ncbi:hypothetical protein HDU78_009325 [Chytriomyces hyalinus]|nr:hypothetical protein HDU78_009325 [Chytriomyces hyalinus]
MLSRAKATPDCKSGHSMDTDTDTDTASTDARHAKHGRKHSRQKTVLSTLLGFSSSSRSIGTADSDSEVENTPRHMHSSAQEMQKMPSLTTHGLGEREDALLNAFNQGLFADAQVQVGGRDFKLHRVVLLQSRLFASLLKESGSESLIDGRTTIVLDTRNRPGLSATSLEIVFRDLYTTRLRSSQVHEKSVFHILAAACFLQTQDLISYCTRFILESVNPANIAFYACQMDSIVSCPMSAQASLQGESGIMGEFARLLTAVRKNLKPKLESYLCQVVNVGLSEANAAEGAVQKKESQSVNETISYSSHQSIFMLLAACPISWFQTVVEADSLCIPDEFSRYLFLKNAAIVRWKQQHDPQAQSTSDKDCFTPKRASNLNKRASGFFGALFNQTSSTGKGAGDAASRKSGEDKAEEETSFQSPQGSASLYLPGSYHGSVASFQSSSAFTSSTTSMSNGFQNFGGSSNSSVSNLSNAAGNLMNPIHAVTRLVNLYGQDFLRKRGSNETLSENALLMQQDKDLTILQLFETAVVYTYMTFAQLERVKSDAIVSDTAVLNSFWMQAELINRFTTPYASISVPANPAVFPAPVGPFRFTVKFSGLQALALEKADAVERGERVVVAASEPIKCCGIDFRIILALEVGRDYASAINPAPTSDAQSYHRGQKSQISTPVAKKQFIPPPSAKKGAGGGAAVGPTPTKRIQTPFLLNMNRSLSLDDLNARTSRMELGVVAPYLNDSVARVSRFVLKASLQRSRIHATGTAPQAAAAATHASSSSSGTNGKQPMLQQQNMAIAVKAPVMAFRLYAFDAGQVAEEGGCNLDQANPVTWCGFDGNGDSREFGVPFGYDFGGGEEEGLDENGGLANHGGGGGIRGKKEGDSSKGGGGGGGGGVHKSVYSKMKKGLKDNFKLRGLGTSRLTDAGNVGAMGGMRRRIGGLQGEGRDLFISASISLFPN